MNVDDAPLAETYQPMRMYLIVYLGRSFRNNILRHSDSGTVAEGLQEVNGCRCQ